jgi:hypothetical protein
MKDRRERLQEILTHVLGENYYERFQAWSEKQREIERKREAKATKGKCLQ